MGIGTIDVINKLDGLLLGDGCVSYQNRYNRYFYTHTSKNKEWLDSLRLWFLSNKINSNIYTKHVKPYPPLLIKGGNYYQLQAFNTDFFREQRKRWYKILYYEDKEGYETSKNIKIVPKDIELTPECVAEWYMGDGSLYWKDINMRGSAHRIEIATHSFSDSEIELLSCLINDYINFDYAYKLGKRIFISHKKGVEMFIDYVKPFIVPCFNYKIPEVN